MVAWLRVLCDACLFVYLRLQATENPGKDHEQQAVPPAEVLPVIPAGNPCPNERAAAHTYALDNDDTQLMEPPGALEGLPPIDSDAGIVTRRMQFGVVANRKAT